MKKIKNIVSVKVMIAIITLVIVQVFLYAPIIGYQFQKAWDDHWVVINSYTQQGFKFQNLFRIFSEFYNGQYAPINQMYYSLLFECFGYNTKIFHLGSLILHILNTLLVYIFIRELLKYSHLVKEKYCMLTAVATTVLFGIHPLMVESVAWISASKVLLYALFYLLGLIFYVKFLGTGKYIYLGLTFFIFAISYLAKEQAVTFPFCLILIDYLILKGNFSRRSWLEKIPFVILTVFFGIIAMKSQGAIGQGALTGISQYPIYQRFFLGAYAIWEYFIKCVIPINLSYIYPFPFNIGENIPIKIYFHILILFSLLFLLFQYARKNQVLLFSICFFIIHLLTVIHIIPISRFVVIADRYVYLSAIGIFFLLANCFSVLALDYKRYELPIILTTMIYLLLLSIGSYNRVKVWENSDTLKKEIRSAIKARGHKLIQESR